MPVSNHKKIYLRIALLLALILLSLADILLGSVSIKLSDITNLIFDPETVPKSVKQIIIDFRLPKLITAIIAGASLSVAGLQMQTVFRNPLAGPYILGISAGGGLGVAVLILGAQHFDSNIGLYGSWAVVTAAWMGSAALMAIIFAVSIRVKDIMTVLILGVLFGGAVSALINILQYFGSAVNLKSFVVWSMGSVSGLSSDQLYILAGASGIGLILSSLAVKSMDLLLHGEEYAQTTGQNLIKARLLIFGGTSILAGTVTAFCGPIGFIGVIVPHIARMVFRSSMHRTLLPAVAMIGAIVLIISDIISGLPGLDTVLPLNSVTSLIGIPVVIYILLKNRI